MEKIAKHFKYTYKCYYCAVNCPSVCQLWKHVMGKKHKKRMLCTFRDAPLNSLQAFLDTYMNDCPILGLEYMVEIQEDVNTYKCQLCGVTLVNEYAAAHVIGMQHLRQYVLTHHPKEISFKDMIFPSENYLSAWHEAALRIHSAYGRKKIHVIKKEDEGPPPAKVSKSSPNTNDLPGKTTDPLPDPSSQKVQTDMMESMKFLEVNCNADLLEFLRNFKIQNDEDAAILKELTQNCTAALMRFREEQLNAELTQGFPSSTDPASTDTDRACHESESCDPESLHNNDWSLSQCSVRKDNDASKPDESIDATETLFSNIKDMEVSEVIANFERIAAENSAFHGINIPDVIRYLQDTGQLKKT